MTVVRNEFEMRREPAHQRDVQAPAVRGLRLAQLRQHADRRALGHRRRADRAPAGVLPDLLPAGQRHRCWWPASSTKPPRSRWSTNISARFRAPRACCPSCTPSSRRRTASARWSCAASVTCSGAASAYHIPAGPARRLRGAADPQRSARQHARRAACTRRSWRPGKAAAVFPASLQIHDPGMAGFGAQVRDGQPLEPVLAQLIAIVEKPAAKPVTDEEVERARTQILKQIELSLNSSENVGLALSDWAGMGDWRLMFVNRDRLRAVKTADVQRVWATYYKQSNRTAALFYPTKTPDRAEMPKAPDVVALVKDYKGDAAKDAGEAFDATPANIEARTKRSKLPGGLELALLPKKTRGGAVFAALSLRFGDEASLKNLGSTPGMTTAMLMRGTHKHTRQQLSDEFDRLKARVNFNSWGSGQYASIETTRENLPAVLTLVAEVAARTGIRSQGARADAHRVARGHRAAAQRSVGAGLHAVPQAPQSLSARATSATSSPSTRASPRQGGHARAGACSSTAISSARSPRSSRWSATSTPPPSRSRWRALLGDWKNAEAVQARRERVLRRQPLEGHRHRDARQGAGILRRRHEPPVARRRSRTIRRWCSATTCWAADSSTRASWRASAARTA